MILAIFVILTIAGGFAFPRSGWSKNLARLVWVLLSLMLLCEISWMSIARLTTEPLAPGVQSLVFLLSVAGGNARFIFPLILAALIFDLKATDHPRFQWRGLVAVPGAYIVLWYLGFVSKAFFS
jgi:hypothetical protein